MVFRFHSSNVNSLATKVMSRWLTKGKQIIDPTASQYRELGLEPPYHLGKGAGFLTKQPSKRAAKLMEIVLRCYNN